jgi:hypothetical protein
MRELPGTSVMPQTTIASSPISMLRAGMSATDTAPPESRTSPTGADALGAAHAVQKTTNKHHDRLSMGPESTDARDGGQSGRTNRIEPHKKTNTTKKDRPK